ncbi:MAG TPA: glycosyltransferase family 1 protein [Opitutales bacterium]|nr:glycosyltransferase family 1 protein [Opitutales bacterium]
MTKLLIDVSHTAHCPALTGVQRVCRELLRNLDTDGEAPQAIIHDRFAKRWRLPDGRERAMLEPKIFGHRGNQRWSFWQRGRGRLGLIRELDWSAWRGACLFAPEIFSAENFRAFGALRAHIGGAAGAIFYDAVGLRLPNLSPAKTVARFPGYLRELAAFDGVAAISEASRTELLAYWEHIDLRSPPPVVTIPLGVESPATSTPLPATDSVRGPLILSVGTLEGRKNQIALLEAAEALWREGAHFRLALAGLRQLETGGLAVERAAQLIAAGRPLEMSGTVSESHLQKLYAACRFTVYPSVYEGFGLPVAESLLRHRPCICGPGGALAEVARDGGCLLVSEPTSKNLAQAMRTLLNDDAAYHRLAREATQRRFPSWADYAKQVSAWLASLRPARALS